MNAVGTRHALMKILVVDDDAPFVELLDAYLKEQGHLTRRADSAAAALEANRAFMPELILLDLRLRSSPGLHLLPELLMDNSKALVLIMTGYPSAATAVEAMNKGAAGYLEKPLDFGQLEEFLKSPLASLPSTL